MREKDSTKQKPVLKNKREYSILAKLSFFYGVAMLVSMIVQHYKPSDSLAWFGFGMGVAFFTTYGCYLKLYIEEDE